MGAGITLPLMNIVFGASSPDLLYQRRNVSSLLTLGDFPGEFVNEFSDFANLQQMDPSSFRDTIDRLALVQHFPCFCSDLD